MDKEQVLWSLRSYVEEHEGIDVWSSEPLKFRIEAGSAVAVFDRGVKGCPKFKVSLTTLEEHFVKASAEMEELREAVDGLLDAMETLEDEVPLNDEEPEVALVIEEPAPEERDELLEDDQEIPEEAVVADFTQIPGVTEDIEQGLYNAGIKDFMQLTDADDATLLAVRGIGKGTLGKIRAFMLEG